jgi:hypothetical protein
MIYFLLAVLLLGAFCEAYCLVFVDDYEELA